MKALIHVLALCALLLFHVPIVTGYYYGLTNPWNWFGNWHSGECVFLLLIFCIR